MNLTILSGNLGADPELRHTGGGTSVLSLRLATTERIKKGEEWQEHTEWHSVILFGKRAESLASMLRKGSKVLVRGVLRTSSWEDKTTGQKRYKTEINADDLELLDSRKGDGALAGAAREQRAMGATYADPQDAASAGGGPDSDIPFAPPFDLGC